MCLYKIVPPPHLKYFLSCICVLLPVQRLFEKKKQYIDNVILLLIIDTMYYIFLLTTLAGKKKVTCFPARLPDGGRPNSSRV